MRANPIPFAVARPSTVVRLTMAIFFVAAATAACGTHDPPPPDDGEGAGAICETDADCNAAAGESCVASLCTTGSGVPGAGGAPGSGDGSGAGAGDGSGAGADAAAPIVAIVEPSTDLWHSGVVQFVVQVTSRASADELQVQATINAAHTVALTPDVSVTGAGAETFNYFYRGTFDTLLLGDGVYFPLLTVTAADVAGRNGVASRRFAVDNQLILQVTTSMHEVIAGEAVDIVCTALRAGTPVSGLDLDVVVVVVDPPLTDPTEQPAELQAGIEPGSARLVATVAGLIQVQCTLRGTGQRSSPTWIVVAPGAPVRVGTRLQQAVIQAGAQTRAFCEATDAYGNVIADPATFSISAPAGMVVAADTLTGSFRVSATLARDYAVACNAGTLTDTNAARLTVVPAAAASTQAALGEVVLRPGVPTAVACTAVDTFGNEVPQEALTVVLVPPFGATPTDAGVAIDGREIRAAKAGFYLVYCIDAAALGADDMGAFLQVVPGLPARWEVALQPTLCVQKGVALPLSVSVYDASGNRVDDYAMSVTSEPPGALDRNASGQFFVTTDGRISFGLALTSQVDEKSTIQPFSASVFADSLPPMVRLETIEVGEVGEVGGQTFVGDRGLMIQAGYQDTGEVRAVVRVRDAISPIGQVLVGDALPAVAANSFDASFNVTLPSAWGLNVVEAMATDACGNLGYLSHAYLRGPQFHDVVVGNSEASMIRQAIAVHLSQAALDDQDRSTLDDLATIAQTAFQSIDWNTLATADTPVVLSQHTPNRPCLATSDPWVEFDAVLERPAGELIAVDGPYIDLLAARDGELAFDLHFNSADLPFRLQLRDYECLPGYGVTSVADLDEPLRATSDLARAWGRFALSTIDGQSRAQTLEIHIDVDAMHLQMQCGKWQTTCDSQSTRTLAAVETAVEDLLETLVTTQLAPLVETFLNNLQLRHGARVTDPITVQLGVTGALDAVTLTGPQGHGELDVRSQTAVNPCRCELPDSQRERALGFLVLGGDDPSFDLQDEQTLGLALKIDLLNQFLWSAWYGGAFDIPNLTRVGGDDYDIAGLDVSLFAHLPPVVMPDAATGGIRVGIGDAQVAAHIDLAAALQDAGDKVPVSIDDLPMTHVDVDAFVSFAAAASVEVLPSGDALRPVFADEPEISVQIRVSSLPQYDALTSVLLAHAVRKLMGPLLADAIEALPLSLDMAAMGIPGLELVLKDTQVDVMPGYLRIQGRLDGEKIAPTPADDDDDDSDDNVFLGDCSGVAPGSGLGFGLDPVTGDVNPPETDELSTDPISTDAIGLP